MTTKYIKKILEAHVYDVAVETPLDEALNLSKRLDNRVLMKREDLQPVHSFKCRGAYNKIAGLSDDLTMALSALSIRIVAPIPGRGVVGIEIPNKDRETVYLKDILEAISKIRSSEDVDNVLHRIREVRLQQGVSLRSAARHMQSDVRTLRSQEQESTDLRLTDLRRWQKALEVPLSELLEETDGTGDEPDGLDLDERQISEINSGLYA